MEKYSLEQLQEDITDFWYTSSSLAEFTKNVTQKINLILRAASNMTQAELAENREYFAEARNIAATALQMARARQNWVQRTQAETDKLKHMHSKSPFRHNLSKDQIERN